VNPNIPAQIRDYFDQSHVALALADADGDNPLRLVNGKFSALTGYPNSAVVGHNCRMLQGEAANEEPRQRIRDFLADDAQASVRTLIVNFRRDGSPFVNLLYMSKLRGIDGQVRYIFASQFDVSRSQPDLLAQYDRDLGAALAGLTPILAESDVVLEGSLMTIANTAATVAQAKLTLADLDGAPFA